MSGATNILLVGLGGFAGAIARYLLGGWVLHHTLSAKFPWGTFTVNLLGCLVIGLLSGLAEKFDWLSPSLRLFLLTGLLGGFTTFSAFGLETVFLLRRGEVLLAAAYAAASVLLCIAAVWLGLRAVDVMMRNP